MHATWPSSRTTICEGIEAMIAPHAGRRHVLDPSGGYDSIRFDEDRRIDYRRVQLGSVIMGAEAFFEAVMNTVRNILPMWLLIGAAAIGAILFAVRARHAQRVPAKADLWLVEGFVLFALLCLNAAGYLGSEGMRVPMGYPMGYLAAAAFFMIPPRRFVAIGIVTFAIFVTWVGSLDLSPYYKLYTITNAGLGMIAAAFGRASIDRIQQISRQHRRRIAEQNVALQDANAALERQNDELNELMAIAAHDLRSPLFGLRSVLDLARSHPPKTADKLQRLLEASTQSITAMVALVSRLLDVHEVEGRTPPRLVPKDLAPLLSAAIKRIEAQAALAGVSIEAEARTNAVWALAHGGSVEQILDNLLANAVRFSPSGSKIRATARLSAELPTIEIVDHGVGIPEAERSALFNKFRRGTIHPLHGQKGSGLGLYAVKILAAAMGAQCSYEPNPEGGSIFRIIFEPILTTGSNYNDPVSSTASKQSRELPS